MRSWACPTCTLNCPRQVFHLILARGEVGRGHTASVALGNVESFRKETMPAPLLLSPRAKQIAEGLVRTGRASDARLFRTWLQLRGTAGNFYWIALDGSALLRGATFDGADELQQSFAD